LRAPFTYRELEVGRSVAERDDGLPVGVLRSLLDAEIDQDLARNRRVLVDKLVVLLDLIGRGEPVLAVQLVDATDLRLHERAAALDVSAGPVLLKVDVDVRRPVGSREVAVRQRHMLDVRRSPVRYGDSDQSGHDTTPEAEVDRAVTAVGRDPADHDPDRENDSEEDHQDVDRVENDPSFCDEHLFAPFAVDYRDKQTTKKFNGLFASVL
jgi:hypothetical protein